MALFALFAVTAVGADRPGIVAAVTGLGVTCTLHPSEADIL